MIRKALKSAATLLVLFHAWLFARDAWAGDLSDIALLARWAAAAGLTGALIALRRQGASLLRSRRGVAIWVLAALLHGPALAGPLEVADLPIAPVVVASLAPAAAATLATLLVLFALGSLRRRTTADVAVGFRTTHACLRRWATQNDVALVGLAPRSDRLWTDLPHDRPIALMLGDERKGLTLPAEQMCDLQVRLPMSGRADSLNVGVAAGVVMYELVRRATQLSARR